MSEMGAALHSAFEASRQPQAAPLAVKVLDCQVVVTMEILDDMDARIRPALSGPPAGIEGLSDALETT